VVIGGGGGGGRAVIYELKYRFLECYSQHAGLLMQVHNVSDRDADHDSFTQIK
jgi:hypothetical protein